MASEAMGRQAQAGVAEMDREHALELQMVRSLQGALARGERATARELLGSLEEFTNAHFLAEQLLMRLHAYPGYAAHQEEHDRLIEELHAIGRALDESETARPGEQSERLERWLLAHMASEDAALAQFLAPATPATEP